MAGPARGDRAPDDGPAPPSPARRQAFDTVESGTHDAGETFDFHATAIADGSRRIDEGAAAAFTVSPGHRGRFEARSLVVLPANDTG